LDDDAGRTIHKDFAHESMRVMSGADDRDEESPGSCFAAVDDRRCEDLVRAAAK
jgi:hypothetical protein